MFKALSLEKWTRIRENIGRETSRDKWNVMIMNFMGRGNSLGSGKNSLVFGEYRLEVRMHKWGLNGLNGMELGKNSLMTFFKEIFHLMGTDDLRGACCDAFELIWLAILLKLHC